MFLISKFIEIDAAHRIPDHHSKCKNLHGHRYKIEMVCKGEPAVAGAQKGMAGGLDFSFMKEEMVRIIDEPCDHGLILCLDDPFTKEIFKRDDSDNLEDMKKAIIAPGYLRADHKIIGKIYLLLDPPTAEVLAEHWYRRLLYPVSARSNQQAYLHYIRVYETPTCWAQYPAT